MATVPSATNQGSRGTDAPRLKAKNDDTAAPRGDPSWPGSMPSSSRAWACSAVSGSLIMASATWRAWAGSRPRCS
jgi:hypothetical protein